MHAPTFAFASELLYLIISIQLLLHSHEYAMTLDTGDTAWVMTSTALVLFMTMPGLALFYSGMIRTKNVLTTIMQSFTITCVITFLWLCFGYSLSFAPAEYKQDNRGYLIYVSHLISHVYVGHVLPRRTSCVTQLNFLDFGINLFVCFREVHLELGLMACIWTILPPLSPAVSTF